MKWINHRFERCDAPEKRPLFGVLCLYTGPVGPILISTGFMRRVVRQIHFEKIKQMRNVQFYYPTKYRMLSARSRRLRRPSSFLIHAERYLVNAAQLGISAFRQKLVMHIAYTVPS